MRTKRWGNSIGHLLGLVLLLISAACGQGGGHGGMGALESVLPNGQDGPWVGEMHEGTYELSNSADPSVIGYYFVEPASGTEGKRKIAVDVKLAQVGQGAHAGLIYGLIDQPRQFYLFMLEPDGSVALYRRDGNGLNQMMSQSVGNRKPDAFVTLAIEETGGEITLKAGGRKIGQIGSSGIGHGATGIAVGGTGRFDFKNFRHQPEPLIAPGATDATASPFNTAQRQEPPARKKGAAQIQPQDMIHLKPFEITDKDGFGQPVVAFTILAPADWVLEGGVSWNRNIRCTVDLVRMNARLTSPDGQMGFELFPIYYAEWREDPMQRQAQQQMLAQGRMACPLQQPFNAEQFITGMLIPGYRQGAQVIARKPTPGVAKARAQSVQGELAGLPQPFGPPRVQTDATRLTIRYNGNEEWLFATTVAVSTSLPTPTMSGMATVTNTSAENVMAFRAPDGHLSAYESLAAVMISSLRVNPRWRQAVENVQAKLNKMQLDAARDQSKAIMNAWREESDQRMRDWNARNAREDRIDREFLEAIRGTETYDDPYTNTRIEFPNDYDSVWTNQVGEYVLVKPETVDPNEHLLGDWTQLKKTP